MRWRPRDSAGGAGRSLHTNETLRSVHDRLAQLADPPRYMARSVFSDLERDAETAGCEFPARWPDALSGAPEIRMLKTIQDFLKDSEGCRARANDTFIVNELVRSREFFDTIEARPLTNQQRRAVVIDEDRNLVVAAAGSGKTSVIVAKAGWLLQKGYRRPSELLLLAFEKDAQKEMEERVRSRLGDEAAAELTVRTFHSLGMSIIGAAEGKRPALAKVAEDDKALYDLLKGIIADLVADPKLSTVMLRWFEDHFAPYKSEHDFQTQGEYWAYVRANEIRSLQGEKVKSFEECEIANFLYLSGVPYEYERSYEHDTATSEKGQYQPDFYLPEAGIYIEHFGLNESGDTAPFIDRDEYLRSMEWKRQLHAEHGTILIETFSYEKAAGELTEKLATKLADHGVTLSPVPPADIFALLEEQGRIDPFTRLVATFLQHYKGAQLSAEEVARRAAKAPDRRRAKAFVTVFGAIFDRYQESLARLRQIQPASMDAWSAGKTLGTGAYSTAARTTRIASTHSPPVPIAEPVCLSRPTALSVAATVASRSRRARAATGGCEPGRENTGRFWVVRITPLAITPEISREGAIGRNLANDDHVWRGLHGARMGRETRPPIACSGSLPLRSCVHAPASGSGAGSAGARPPRPSPDGPAAFTIRSSRV